MKKKNRSKTLLDQFFSKNLNNKELLQEEIFKRIKENSEVEYILDKGYLKYLNNYQLLQFLTPFIRLLNTYRIEFLRSGNQKFLIYHELLLKGYFAYWSKEELGGKTNLRFDGYYRGGITITWHYRNSNKYSKRYAYSETEEEQLDTDLKFYTDGTVNYGKAHRGLIERDYYAQGRFIYSSNKVYFFLKDQKKGSIIVICEGNVNENTIDISILYELPGINMSEGPYKFFTNTKPCAKLYQFSTKDHLDIPLPEMARKALECQSDKVYRCYKENGEFDVVIGAKYDHEVKMICEDVSEIIHDRYFRLPNNFSGYACQQKKSGAIYHGPTWFWWKRKIQKREKKDVYGDLYKRTKITIKYIPLKPEDLLIEHLMEIVKVQQNATIFKLTFDSDADSDVVVFAGTSDKELVKRIFHERFWTNPDKETRDYVEQNLNIWGNFRNFFNSDLIRKGAKSAKEKYQTEVLQALKETPDLAIANLFEDFNMSFLEKLEIGEKRALINTIFNASINIGNNLNKRNFIRLLSLLFSPPHLDLLETQRKKDLLWNFCRMFSLKYYALDESRFTEIIKMKLHKSKLPSLGGYQVFELLQKANIYNLTFRLISKENLILILTYLFELGHHYEIYAHLCFSLPWRYVDLNFVEQIFLEPGEIIKEFLTKKLYLRNLYSKSPKEVKNQVKGLRKAVYNLYTK